MKNILILIFASLLSFGLFANDQQPEIDAIEKFIGTQPMLLEGHDEAGECRIMIYSASTSEITNIWFEGTFQSGNNGPVAGYPVPVMVSSNSEVAQIKDFSINVGSLYVKMIYPGQPTYSMRLKKSADGQFSTVTYKVGNVIRRCLDLKRLL